MSEKKVIAAYLIATHGRRKVTPDHPAVRQQVANILAFVRRMPSRIAETERVKVSYRYDYARTVRGISALPDLESALARVAEGRFLVMDDLSRLWRACPDREAKIRLLADLEPYSTKLMGMRQMALLSDLSGESVEILVSGRIDPRFRLEKRKDKRPRVERQHQTMLASIISKKARREAADVKAHDLASIREDLQRQADRVTNKMIADCANEQGLRTTRGGFWRPDTVARQLKRLSVDRISEDER